MDNEEVVELTIDDTPATEQVAGPSTSDDDLAALREKLKSAENRAASAERRASTVDGERLETQRRLQTETDTRFSAQETAIANAKAAAMAEKQSVMQRLKSAKENADAGAEVEAMDQLQNININLSQIAGNENWLKNEKAKAQAASTRVVQTQQQTDGVDLSKYTPKARSWIDKHPEFLEDPKFRHKVFAAHELATADEIPYDTPEYFSFIEKTIGLKPEQEAAVEPTPKVKTSASATPPSRSVGGQTTTSSGKREIRMTQAEVEACRISDPEAFEKDRNKALLAYRDQQEKLRSEGRIGAN